MNPRRAAQASAMLYYAIGDIHGCTQALDVLLETISRHSETAHRARPFRIVLLGDYVDRGPDSAGALDRAIALEAAGHIVLPGNHEKLMHDALSGGPEAAQALAMWRHNGGEATLANYGVTDFDAPDRTLVSPVHLAFLDRLFDGRAFYHLDRKDGLFFVHAGVVSEDRLSEQDRQVLLWARPRPDEDELWVEGLHVVHGHTPRQTPDRLRHRTGLDTGAVYGGQLSAGVFVDGALTDVLTASGLEEPAVEPRWR